MSWELGREDTSFWFVRFPILQIFVELFRRNLQSSVSWKRMLVNPGVHQLDLWMVEEFGGRKIAV